MSGFEIKKKRYNKKPNGQSLKIYLSHATYNSCEKIRDS